MIDIANIEDKKLREKAKFWVPIIEDWEQAKEPKRIFCKKNKLNPSTFYRWLNFLSGNIASPNANKKITPSIKSIQKGSGFIYLDIQKPLLASESSGLYLKLPKGMSLAIAKGFDKESFSTLYKILVELC